METTGKQYSRESDDRSATGKPVDDDDDDDLFGCVSTVQSSSVEKI